MLNRADYFISDEALALLNSPEEVERRLLKGETFQSILGFSPDAMYDFYEAALGLFRKERLDDAENAFVFLTTMNPTVTDFWLGLGCVEIKKKDYEAALIPFKWAVICKPTHIKPYKMLAECCLLMGDDEQAKAVLDQAIAVGRSDPSLQGLYEEALEARTYLEEA